MTEQHRAENKRGFLGLIANIFWDYGHARLRLFWRLACFIAIYSLFTFTVSLGLGAMPSLFKSVEGSISAILSSSFMISFSSLATLLLTALAMWIAARALDRRPFADFGFHIGQKWLAAFGFGLVLGAILMLLIFVVELALGWVIITDTLTTAEQGALFLPQLLLCLALFVCVGFYEEMISRGYMIKNLSEGLNLSIIGSRAAIVIAWVGSSILFGLAHSANPNFTVTSMINLIIAGIFLGLGYVLTGELAIPIGLHISWNFFQGNIFGFPVSGISFGTSVLEIQQSGPVVWTGGAFGPEAGLMGLMAMLIGSLLIMLWVHDISGHVRLCPSLSEPPV